MRKAWILVAWCASSLCLAIAVTADDPPAAPAAVAPAGTARIVGKVPVLQRKSSSAVKDYGPPPAFKVDAPDPPASAVWVGSGAPVLDPVKAAPARVEQRGYQFRPALSVVQAGTPVVFPNEDQLYHSVFSYSPAKRFDLGRFRKGEEPNAVVLDTPGVVQLFCEVHEHMRANVVVVDTPWFAVTDPDGRFAIDGVAPGRHVVSIWLSPKQTVTREVEVKAGQVLEVDWSDAAKEPAK